MAPSPSLGCGVTIGSVGSGEGVGVGVSVGSVGIVVGVGVAGELPELVLVRVMVTVTFPSFASSLGLTDMLTCEDEAST